MAAGAPKLSFAPFPAPIRYVLYVQKQIFDASADTFSRFATDDFADPSPRGLTNALSNAKRAIANRVDAILYVSGVWGFASREQWPMPKRIKRLQEIGYSVPAGLLDVVNLPRNDLEHKYILPKSAADISKIIGTTHQFLASTRQYLALGVPRAVVTSDRRFPHYRFLQRLRPGTSVLELDFDQDSIDLHSASGTMTGIPIANLGVQFMTRLAQDILQSRSTSAVSSIYFSDEASYSNSIVR